MASDKEQVVVVGVDFGTHSVRASVFSDGVGRLGSATAEIPVVRSKVDPKCVTQRPQDHLNGLVQAIRGAIKQSGVNGHDISALAIDTTGSTTVPVGANLQPLDNYYLWCDHRSAIEAAEITEAGRKANLEALQWSGGVYSSEWGFAKTLHWLRHNPTMASSLSSVFEHCDMVVAVLCGIKNVAQAPRSICAMGHKWMYNEKLGGLPQEEFLASVDQRLRGLRQKLSGRYATSDQIAGGLCAEWADHLALKPGIPIPVGGLDAHWDAVGAGIREGDIVNVVGTSTCIMAIAREVAIIPGVCGIVNGSINPNYYGIEAGLSACGDVFEAIAKRAGTTVTDLSNGLEKYRAGQTGLLRLCWDNGDRTVLADPHLSGVSLGWNLGHTAQDEFFAAIESTAFHTRIIIERLTQYGVPVHRVINGGGIPQKNDTLNQIYADVFERPVMVPEDDVTSVGSAIFAFLAAGAFRTLEEAQDAMCPRYRLVKPRDAETSIYNRIYPIFKELYFELGDGEKLASLEKITNEIRNGTRMASSHSIRGSTTKPGPFR